MGHGLEERKKFVRSLRKMHFRVLSLMLMGERLYVLLPLEGKCLGLVGLYPILLAFY
jgi:hypothetical protein